MAFWENLFQQQMVRKLTFVVSSPRVNFYDLEIVQYVLLMAMQFLLESHRFARHVFQYFLKSIRKAAYLSIKQLTDSSQNCPTH